MRYLSVCSGIEAATCAWHPLGWEPVAFSEIEPFPSKVLAHHYPSVPNWGDMTKFKEWPNACICTSRIDGKQERRSGSEGIWNIGRRDVHAKYDGSSCSGDNAQRGICDGCGGTIVDLLVGGTPCQSFSVAGLRKGLADPRGNLMLTYLAIADRYRPRWLVWENVPGVLSSHGGRDFGTFLGALGELGYGFAYRVLDAQYFGVAQRRRRVFVVGCLGDWRRAAAVLFERESLSGNPAPRREAREIAPTIPSRSTAGGGLGTDFDCDGGPICVATGQARSEILVGMAPTLNCNHEAPYIARSLRGEGFDASEDGAGRGTPLVPVAIRTANTSANGHGISEGVAHTLDQAQGQCVAFHNRQDPDVSGSITRPLGAKDNGMAVAFHTANSNMKGPIARTDGIFMGVEPHPSQSRHAVMHDMQVRRLTPRECERLQGFPDDYTDIRPNGKPTPDGARYKALGNSMAVPVMAWIGNRIQMVEVL